MEARPRTPPRRMALCKLCLTMLKEHDWHGAYAFVAPSSNVDEGGFVRDLAGRNGSLRTYSQLDSVNTRVLHEAENEATVRTEIKYCDRGWRFF